MKKTIKILTILAMLAISVAAVTPALAYDRPSRTLGERERPFSDLLIAAFAAETGLTVEEVQAFKDSGMTFVEIAQDLGYLGEDLINLFDQVRDTLLDMAVSEGLISEEMAARIAERIIGFGPRIDKILERIGFTR